jgi:hypothetical protein
MRRLCQKLPRPSRQFGAINQNNLPIIIPAASRSAASQASSDGMWAAEPWREDARWAAELFDIVNPVWARPVI